MRALMFTCMIAAGLHGAGTAGTTETVTIKMVLNNTQAREVRDGDGRSVVVELTNAQKKLVRVRAPRFQGRIIRVASGQLSAANKISLTILKPRTVTPILRVEPRGTRATDETRVQEALRNLVAMTRADVDHMRERLAVFTERMEALEKRLRGM